MRSSSIAAVLLVLAPAVGVSASYSALRDSDYPHKLSPKLDPEAHDKFFDHDYPADKRPPMHYNFQHPYPIMQDSNEYADDYVKDENSDGGEWKAQERFDRLRSTLGQKQTLLKKAIARQRGSLARLAEATGAEREARLAADAARAAEHKKAQESDVKHHALDSGDHALADAGKLVDDKVKSLEDCEKDLAKAKEHLKQLQVERKAAEYEVQDSDHTRDKASAERDANIVEQAKAAVEVKLQAVAHIKAYDAYTAKDVDYRSDELPVRVAASKLKLLRHEEVDRDGGVYYSGIGLTTGPPTTPQPPPSLPIHKRVWPRMNSGAMASSSPSVLLAALLTAAAIAFAA